MNAPYQLVSLADMMKLPISKLVASLTHITDLGRLAHDGTYDRPNQNMGFQPLDYAALIANVAEFCDACREIGLTVTLNTAQELQKIVGQIRQDDGSGLIHSKDVGLFAHHASAVASTFVQESKTKVAFIVSPSSASYFSADFPLFGADVDNKFPSLTDEIAESAKCYALERGTASAFHSLRCLEAGIRAMARCLGIPDPTKGAQRNWGSALGEIKKGCEAKWPDAPSRMTGDGDMFEKLHASLAAMQNPYRNATMHLEQKYTPEESLHLFELVKGLMRQMAARMDEDGLPLA